MMKRSLISLALFALTPFYMTDEAAASAAPVEPAESATAQAADASAATAEGDQAAPATVTIEVPAQHVDLIQRATALLSKDFDWLKDNIEAGIAHFEAMFKDDEAPKS